MAEFIEFPIFDGVSGDVRPWISWLEDFFVRERFTAEEKMNMAQSLLEGEAYAWFYRQQKILIFQSWEDLKANLWLMFGDFADSYQESISSMATVTKTIPVEKYSTQQKIVEDSVEIVAEILEDEASYIEKTLIPQYQVPISSLEPSLSLSSEPLDVSAAWPSEIERNNRVYSRSVLECVKNKTNAHQVFDKTSPHKERLQPKNKRKLSLSLKTWMFKFKPASKRSKSLDVKFFSVEEIAWLMKDSKEIYRSNSWMVFDRGKTKNILGDVTSEAIEALAKHCPQLTDLGFLDCMNNAMRGRNTSSHNLVHLMWHFKSQKLILLSLRNLLHRFILVLQRALLVQYRTCIDPNHQGLIVLIMVRLVMLTTRCNILFLLHVWKKNCWCQRQQNFSAIWHRWRRKPLLLLHFWKKNCWYQRLFLLSGLMMIGRREFLVQWQHRDSSENSWMLSQDFASLYPASKLEDKLVFRGESIDTIQGLVDDVAESSSQRKDSNCERSFAVELEISNKRRKQSSLCFLCELLLMNLL